jgi:hypothetical protein
LRIECVREFLEQQLWASFSVIMGVRKVPAASRSRRTVSADLSAVRSWGLDLHEPSTRERVVEQAVGFVLEGIACESEERLE